MMTPSKTLHRIAVPLEISEISAEVLPVVCGLFAPAATELTLLTVAHPLAEFMADDISGAPPPANQTPFAAREEWQTYRQGLEERLYREARHLREAGYQVRTAFMTGDTVHEIFNFVEQGQFDLLAMATDGNKGMSRQVFGSMAEQIARLISVPTLMVRHAADGAAATLTKQQPLHFLQAAQGIPLAVATDGSQHSREAVRLATDLAQAFSAKLEVIVTVSEHMGAAYDQKVMQTVQELFKDQPDQPTLTPLVGPADVVLGPYLEQHSADLLVMGAFNDRSAGSHANIGMIAHRVAEAAPMSMLMVKGHHVKVRHLLACFAVGDRAVIDTALQFAKALGADLQLLHVLPSQADVAPKFLAPNDPALQHVLDQDPRLATFLQTTLAAIQGQGVDRSKLQVWRGDPLKTILNLVEKGSYDLIMVGNHSGRNFFQDTMANAVLSYAPTSVLVVRTRSKGSTK